MLKLYHNSTLVGLITKSEPYDMGWMIGNIELTPDAEAFREAFMFMTNEDRTKPWPGDEAIFDDWFIEYEDGKRRETIFPAIHYDGDVVWRIDDGV